MARPIALAVLLVALAAGRAESQWQPARFQPAHPAERSDVRPPLQIAAEPGFEAPFFAAAGLGLLGWGIGALAGRAIQGDCSGEFCEFEGIIYGGAAGGGVGLALGAHLGNRRRGSFPVDLVTSGLVWGAGTLLAPVLLNNDGGGVGLLTFMIALPVTQLVTTVLVERSTGQAKARRASAPQAFRSAGP